MRVKVRIKDKLFLVPIPPEGSQSKTIGWLCDEAADRYYKSYNLQLKLNLYTQDGALLSPTDLAVMVLTHNEEVWMLHLLYIIKRALCAQCPAFLVWYGVCLKIILSRARGAGSLSICQTSKPRRDTVREPFNTHTITMYQQTY